MLQLLLPLIYLAFISLGLPDAALGAAWPAMYEGLDAGLSWAGGISTIIAVGTIISSLLSQRLNRALGTGLVTALSVGATALALVGFSVSGAYWQLCLWAVPYGLGAGSVDAALNNYVAQHYASRHMSWLHCMWGVGASVGPFIMGRVLAGGGSWNRGFVILAVAQVALSAVLFLSLPMWKRCDEQKEEKGAVLSLRQVLAIPGAPQVMLAFFFYCAVEQVSGLWAGSYLVFHGGLSADEGAQMASLLFLGVTLGRALSGFLTLKLNDRSMIWLGFAVAAVGSAVLLAAWEPLGFSLGLLLIGFGCAPIYPCIIHMTPQTFGREQSEAMIGVQMACAYTGTCLMPPLFGLLAQYVGVGLLPVLLLAGIGMMAWMFSSMERKTQ
ncbi:MAG: MFS transporter [Oscillospiraceae bacterium]|nr:MFS transporter [Oscillospiraceae bacterium]